MFLLKKKIYKRIFHCILLFKTLFVKRQSLLLQMTDGSAAGQHLVRSVVDGRNIVQFYTENACMRKEGVKTWRLKIAITGSFQIKEQGCSRNLPSDLLDIVC